VFDHKVGEALAVDQDHALREVFDEVAGLRAERGGRDKYANRTENLTVDVRYLALSIAAWARRAWSAAFVYRCTSLKLVWPVIAAISCMVHPASARRRAVALRNPCAEQ
jgi:hypothetical protein